MENNYLLGKEKYPETVVGSKRLLLDFVASGIKSNNSNNYVKQDDDQAGVTFSETSYDEYKKTMQYQGCGKKGHFLKECNKTSAKNKEDIFAMVKSGDFKTTKKGV